jgi:hypothetical protein
LTLGCCPLVADLTSAGAGYGLAEFAAVLELQQPLAHLDVAAGAGMVPSWKRFGLRERCP